MPRAKRNTNEPYYNELSLIASLKHPIIDLIYDFKIIYPLQMQFFSDYLESYEIEKKYNFIKSVSVKPSFKTRIYIVTDMDYVPLVLADMDEFVVANLYYTLTLDPADELSPDYFNISPKELNTVYIFNANNLICNENISTACLARLMAVFHNENLVDFSAPRYALYGEPRRNKKYFLP